MRGEPIPAHDVCKSALQGAKKSGIKRDNLFISSVLEGDSVYRPRRATSRFLRDTNLDYVDLLLLDDYNFRNDDEMVEIWQ